MIFSVPALASPLVLLLGILLFLVNPAKIFKYQVGKRSGSNRGYDCILKYPLLLQARRWMLTIFFRIFFAPLAYVCFADFWVADQASGGQRQLKK